MTACVNKKSKRVAAVVTASLVGALSIGAPAVALAANNTSIDLLATDANAFAKGTVSYKYGMEAGADFTYTGYQQGLVPSKVEVYNGDTVFPELRPASGKQEANKSYYYYVKVGTGGTVEVNGVTVQYKNAKGKLVDLAGTSVKDAGNYVRPTSEGTYAVVVVSTDADKKFDSAVKVADTFTITGQSLDDAVLYEGSDMSDTDFAFTGEGNSDRADNFLNSVNVALDGVQLDESNEVMLTVWDKGGKTELTSSDWLIPGSTYVLKVDGVDGSRFDGQSIQREFVYGQLDLSKASIDGKVVLVNGGNAPSKDSKFDDVVAAINGFANTDSTAEGALNQEHVNNDTIDVSFVSGPNGSIAKGEGAYTFKLTAKKDLKDENGKSVPAYVTGEAEVKVYYVDHEAEIDFANADLDEDNNGIFDVVLNPAEPNFFDLSDIVVKSDKAGSNEKVTLKKGTDYTVAVKNAAGEAVSEDALKTPGSYFVTVTADTELAEGETVYGSKTVKVNVAYSVVEDIDVFFSFDKENYESDEVAKPTYDGSDYFDNFTIKVTAGSKQLAEGTDYEVVVTKTQVDGKKVVVDKIVDAGYYDVAVKGITFAGTHHFGIDVQQVKLIAPEMNLADIDTYENTSEIKIADLLKGYTTTDIAGKPTDPFLYLPATGSVISPKFTYAGANGKVVELPADVFEVEYRDADNKVVDLKDAGVYTARLVSKSEAGNYLVDFKFTNLKVAESKVFSDVQTSDWFYNAVFNAKKLGYIAGIGDGSLFAPNADIKRGDVAVVLFRMANGENYDDEDFSFDVNQGFLTGFADVDGHAYYAKAIAWASEAGVVNGYADGTFRPEKNITSEEFAAMLSNFAKLKGEDITVADADKVLAAYPDGSAVSDWAKQAVAWAVENDVMGNGAKLDATSNISRARVAAMAVNYQPDGKEDLIKPVK